LSAERVDRVDVVVVGAGPAGLTAAAELSRRGVERVVVVEREAIAGGIPRHSDHLGYGRRDLRRVLTGPSYARLLTSRAVGSGADLRLRSMVTDWAGDTSLMVTSPQGRYRLDADAIVLATGARERPRSARLVPGDRPNGVLTTGLLQSLVTVHGRTIEGPAVVVGAELVSWSAALTLRHAGVRQVSMVTSYPRPEIQRPLAVAGRSLLRVRLSTSTRVARVIGSDQVEAVELVDNVTGRRWSEACRTVVFTGDWVPDHELATMAGLDGDPAHRGPSVDTGLRTSLRGVFAAGNLVHPVDTADVAALDGRHAAAMVSRHLSGRDNPGTAVPLLVEPPLRWISPGLFRPGDGPPSLARLLLWTDAFAAAPVVEAFQQNRVIGRARLMTSVGPGRVLRVPWRVIRDARASDGPVTLRIDSDVA
jgi:thioredoxin reductase